MSATGPADCRSDRHLRWLCSPEAPSWLTSPRAARSLSNDTVNEARTEALRPTVWSPSRTLTLTHPPSTTWTPLTQGEGHPRRNPDRGWHGVADGAVVNNDFLKDAGLKPADALAQDDPKTDPSAIKYVNLFVAQKDKADDETYKKIVELFHSKAVMDVVQEETRGTAGEGQREHRRAASVPG